MRLFTPTALHYPITVTKLLRKPGDSIELNAPLFYYEYKSTREEWDEDKRENVEKERTWPATFESELEGQLETLDVHVGQVITRRVAVAEVEEVCKHEVQFGLLCASCGKDMSETATYNETIARKNRAPINTVHGRQDLLISADEAAKNDDEGKRRLLDSRRLSLVVDLDQTIIHASVEPTIGEWQNDPKNPNHAALQDVGKFQLEDDKPNTWYYIKPRPGLQAFLSTLSELYEMHIYTMGTRAYAENVAQIIDPQRKIFGDRILSRNESGSMTAKNLKRLFPVDTKMVVIIDDRADVWHWTHNLIKVNVFEFFVGIGDINSSFLPKRPELEALKAAPKMERSPSNKTPDTADSESSPESAASEDGPSTAPTTPPSVNGASSAVEQMVTMAGSQDAKSIEEKSEEQQQSINEQVEERPMLKKQQLLEQMAKAEEARESPAVEAAAELLADQVAGKSVTASELHVSHKYRHNLLADDDTELTYLERSLRNIHNAYFNEYDLQAAGTKGGRIAELRPGHSKKRSIDQLEHIPDAAVIMDDLKAKVLAGVNIVFSGVVPLGVDIHSHDAALWAKSFGATVSENITKKTTHVIASPERRTAKVRQAIKRSGRIAIVTQHWLHACFAQWTKVNENPYRIHSDAPVNGAGELPASFEGQSYPLSDSDENSAQTEEETDEWEVSTANTNGNGLSLAIDTDAEDWAVHAPSLSRQDSSPTETENADNWDDLDAEFAEFMGGSEVDDDSDAESTKSITTDDGPYKSPTSQRKRKPDHRESDDVEGSRLQKRKREALERTTSLTNLVQRASTETPKEEVDDEDEGEDGELDLEAALAAEMEKQEDEDNEEEAEAEAEAASKK